MRKLSYRSYLLWPGLVMACTAHAPQEPALANSNPARSVSADATEASSNTVTRDGAPDFELYDLQGRALRLSEHRGRVVLIDFWATYCEPCLHAMPHLAELYERYRDEGFVVLGVSIDGPESIAQVRTETSRLQVPFPVLLDESSEVVSLYNPKTSAPYSVLVDRDGRILRRTEGYTQTRDGELEAQIQAALRGAR